MAEKKIQGIRSNLISSASNQLSSNEKWRLRNIKQSVKSRIIQKEHVLHLKDILKRSNKKMSKFKSILD